MSNELCLVYITTKDNSEAEKISTHLLDKKLIACSNTINNMTSQYVWDGKTENSKECILILKTLTRLFNSIEVEVDSIHSYDCPCIFSIPMNNCSQKYKTWLINQIGEAND